MCIRKFSIRCLQNSVPSFLSFSHSVYFPFCFSLFFFNWRITRNIGTALWTRYSAHCRFPAWTWTYKRKCDQNRTSAVSFVVSPNQSWEFIYFWACPFMPGHCILLTDTNFRVSFVLKLSTDDFKSSFSSLLKLLYYLPAGSDCRIRTIRRYHLSRICTI